MLAALLLTPAFAASSRLSYPDNKTQRPIDSVKQKEIESRLPSLQLPFIKNEAQAGNAKVKYYAPTWAGTVFVTDNEILYALKSRDRSLVLKEKLLNTNSTKAEGVQETPTRVNYFIGNNKSTWRHNLPTYKQVNLGEAYPHVQVKLAAQDKHIEKLFIVEPGGRPQDIRLQIKGARSCSTNKAGELEIMTEAGIVKMTKPVAYQEIDGKRISVPVSYFVPHSAIPSPQSPIPNPRLIYGFTVAAYDRTKELVIDPLLASTFIGGGNADYAYALAADTTGNVFVAGQTYSSDFSASSGALDTSLNGPYDVFIAKFNSDLSTLLAATFLGGENSDSAYALAVDVSGNLFVAGQTSSSNFPIINGYDTSFNGASDVFVSKLDNTLSALSASTFLGGSSNESARALALSASGDVLIAGYTSSSDYPTTAGAYDRSFNSSCEYNYPNNEYVCKPDAFVSKLSSSLNTLSASTFIGGGDSDGARALAIDPSGNVLICGYSPSSDFPVSSSGVYDSTHNGGVDAFIFKFDNALTVRLAATFVGGSSNDYASSIALDTSGNVFIAGYTSSTDFPVPSFGVYDPTHNGEYDAYVFKISGSLASRLAATFAGGSDYDEADAMSIKSGDILITGYTSSSNFPTTVGAYDATHNGGADAFVTRLNNSLTTLRAGTFFGSSRDDRAQALAVTAEDVLIAGGTEKADYPTAAGSYDTSFNDVYDAFVSKVDGCLASGSADADNDGYCILDDNCPNNCNVQQLDADGDEIGDVCDPSPGCGGCGQSACEQQC